MCNHINIYYTQLPTPHGMIKAICSDCKRTVATCKCDFKELAPPTEMKVNAGVTPAQGVVLLHRMERDCKSVIGIYHE